MNCDIFSSLEPLDSPIYYKTQNSKVAREKHKRNRSQASTAIQHTHGRPRIYASGATSAADARRKPAQDSISSTLENTYQVAMQKLSSGRILPQKDVLYCVRLLNSYMCYPHPSSKHDKIGSAYALLGKLAYEGKLFNRDLDYAYKNFTKAAEYKKEPLFAALDRAAILLNSNNFSAQYKGLGLIQQVILNEIPGRPKSYEEFEKNFDLEIYSNHPFSSTFMGSLLMYLQYAQKYQQLGKVGAFLRLGVCLKLPYCINLSNDILKTFIDTIDEDNMRLIKYQLYYSKKLGFIKWCKKLEKLLAEKISICASGFFSLLSNPPPYTRIVDLSLSAKTNALEALSYDPKNARAASVMVLLHQHNLAGCRDVDSKAIKKYMKIAEKKLY